MSSKKKTTATKDDGKPALVPKLRFPEFRHAAGWKERPLADFLSESRLPGNKGNVAKKITVKLWGNGVFEKNDAIQGSINTQYFRRKAGQFIYSKLDFLNQAFGIIPPSLDNFESTVDLPCFDFADGLNSGFLLEYVKRRDFYERLGETADGSRKARRIHAETFLSFPITLPTPAEQHKIAECLSSVDELMAAQARKVDALKTHKKGLMQQLFPREGETQPRLRFPEFQNAGEWETMSIQEMIDRRLIVGHLDGNHGELYPKAEEFSPNKEGIPYVSANDFMNGSVDLSKCKRLPIERARLFKKGVAKDGDILFAHNATVGPVAKLDTSEEFVILSTTATYFRCDGERLSNDFLKSALSSPEFVAQYSRVMSQSTRNQVPITTQRKLSLQIPKPPEQQRIADCLTSLDDLIAAQTQKLAALKTHKKGLMQQLFPSPEGMP